MIKHLITATSFALGGAGVALVVVLSTNPMAFTHPIAQPPIVAVADAPAAPLVTEAERKTVVLAEVRITASTPRAPIQNVLPLRLEPCSEWDDVGAMFIDPAGATGVRPAGDEGRRQSHGPRMMAMADGKFTLTSEGGAFANIRRTSTVESEQLLDQAAGFARGGDYLGAQARARFAEQRFLTAAASLPADDAWLIDMQAHVDFRIRHYDALVREWRMVVAARHATYVARERQAIGADNQNVARPVGRPGR